MTENDVKRSLSLPNGCIFGLVSILLGFILTLCTTLYQRDPDLACDGGLSAGFPLGFICDDTGGSPISSWGRIDLADWANMNPRVFLLDFLLFSALLSLTWIILTGLFRKGMAQNESFRWAVLLCLGYILAFLFAFVSFQSSRLDFEIRHPRTPTPFIPTPTSIGSLPPLESTPSSSPNP